MNTVLLQIIQIMGEMYMKKKGILQRIAAGLFFAGSMGLLVFLLSASATSLNGSEITNTQITSTNIVKPEVFSSATQKTTKTTKKTIEPLQVHYIDVGQGDCILITCNGKSMLIDAGDNNKGTQIQKYIKKQGITTLDYMIGSHPDSDHIGGLDVILYKFSCSTIIMPDIENDTDTYQDVIDTMESKTYKNTSPVVGTKYTLGDATFTIIAPNDTYEDTNNSSVGILLTHGENTFLFTGDAEEKAEKDILDNDIKIEADVYKVSHHGSKTATSQDFLDAVNPTYAVISCEEENTYGFPSADTLNKLREMGVEVFRTDEQGTIVAKSDGKKITWNCSPSETWQAGEATGSSTSTTAKTTKPKTTTAPATADAAVADTEPAVSEPAIVAEAPPVVPTAGNSYVVNTNTGKFHIPSCYSVEKILPENRLDVTTTRDDLIARGYVACKNCNP